MKRKAMHFVTKSARYDSSVTKVLGLVTFFVISSWERAVWKRRTDGFMLRVRSYLVIENYSSEFPTLPQ